MSLDVTSNLPEQVPNINMANNPVTGTANSNQIENKNDNKNENKNDSEQIPLLNPEKQLKSEISKANSHLKYLGTRAEFRYYEDVKRVAIKVIDNETNEVIKEIPPKETIELLQKLLELTGLLYDKKG